MSDDRSIVALCNKCGHEFGFVVEPSEDVPPTIYCRDHGPDGMYCLEIVCPSCGNAQSVE